METMECLDLSLPYNRDQLQSLLVNSITLLCRNAVSFRSKLSIEGLLGITVDDQTVLLVNVNELLTRGDEDNDTFDETTTESGTLFDAVEKTSSSRRKSKVTRKAVVNLENDEAKFSADFNDDWNTEEADCDVGEGSPSEIAHDGPLNLVKYETPEETFEKDHMGIENGDENDALVGSAEMKDEVGGNDVASYPIPGTSAALSHSWPLPSLPQGNIRRYGSYGYIINHGNDVIFSCNQCPKVFRNRVSLWRHGVKHKGLQGMTPKNLPPKPSMNQSSLGKQLDTNENVSKISMKSPNLVMVQSNMVKYQHNLGIKASPVSSYGVLSEFGKSSWFTCIICHEKFSTRAALWRHKTKHAGTLAGVDRRNSSHTTTSAMNHGVDEARQTVMDLSGNDLNKSSFPAPLQNAAHSIVTDDVIGINGASPKSQDLSPQDAGNIDEDAELASRSNNLSNEGTLTEVAKLHQLTASVAQSSPLKVSRSSNGRISVSGNRGNVINTRPIGNYGYVVTTPEGKTYNCVDCSKFFKNRVSLWKHQSKHQ